MRIKETIQELRELGLDAAFFRIGWEMRLRSGWIAQRDLIKSHVTRLSTNFVRKTDEQLAYTSILKDLPWQPSSDITTAIAPLLTNTGARDVLTQRADAAARGLIHCFGGWDANFSHPIDWHINPTNSHHWRADAHWTEVLKDEPRVGEVKFSWEAARFPQAYHLSRAAVFAPKHARYWGNALAAQIEHFIGSNPAPRGIHWFSSQELVIRLVAWLFSAHVFSSSGDVSTSARIMQSVRQALPSMADHIEHYLPYAEHAVANNHLLTEALGLLICGQLLPSHPHAKRWIARGWRILQREAVRQIYPDGAYIMTSYNYHRTALQILILGRLWAQRAGLTIPPTYDEALITSVDFLWAHQNPIDGRLPNYGANDGSQPYILSTCDFCDFRPTLQTISLMLRQERLYPAGPWDEEAAWLLGPQLLSAPLRRAKRRRLVSFSHTGFHVLRSRDEQSFATFRCGSVLDRYNQIDMLHVDIWWRGQNILIDGGSYIYNGDDAGHAHFLRTESHNTVMVDGRDQMLHYRRFKCLYPTRASVIGMLEVAEYCQITGEHYAYTTAPNQCVHRRTVHFDDAAQTWTVIDQIYGDGIHDIRLHWLCGPFPYELTADNTCMVLNTPAGPFQILVSRETTDKQQPQVLDVAIGHKQPLRGWHSRYFGQRLPCPSIVVSQKETLPVTWVTTLRPG